MSAFPMDGHEFGLCLTHDVDRPYKGLQAPYYAIRDRSPHHLRALLPDHNPWWTFDRVTGIESDLGVRSAFYFLCEPPIFERPSREWLRPHRWIEHLGRYDPTDPEIAALVRDLDERGWEIGLHGSLGTHRDIDRLREEKRIVESVLGREIAGGRQHWLRLDVPWTWKRQADLGLKYDTSLGSTEGVGFRYGYDPIRPFDDDFVVFPLTIMEKVLVAETENIAEAWAVCERLLAEARENGAVMTVLWHPRCFAGADFPGLAGLYRDLIERALELGAWVGPPGDLYAELERRRTNESPAVAHDG